MALRVWLPLNGDPNMLDDLSDLVKNIGISGDIIPERVGTHHSFSSGGKLGYALTFIGAASDYLCMPGLKLQTFSWACWFKCTGSTTATSQRILSEGRDTGSRGAEIWLSQNGTTLYFQAHGVTHNTTVELDKWYHVAFTCGDGVFSSYLNGNLINSSAYTANCDYAQSNDKFVIGKMAYSYTNTSNYFPFVGQINDVRIYDHCLSPLEVKEISQGLILHYKLDGNSGGVGENIILTNSDFSNGTTGWSNWATVQSREIITIGNKKWAHIVKAANAYGGYSRVITIKPNTIYTVSATFYASGTTKGILWWHYRSSEGGANLSQRSTSFDLTTTPQRYSTQIPIYTNANYTVDRLNLMIGTPTETFGDIDIYFTDIKIEEGSIATSYIQSNSEMGIDTTKIVDSSGYGNDGIITGILATDSNETDGRYSISTYFSSGNTYYITTPTLTLPGDAITMNFWFKSSNKAPGADYHMPLAAAASSNQAYEMSIHKNGYLRGGLVVAGTRKVDNCTSTKLLDGNWHMCTMTYDGAIIKRYVDAVMEKSTTATGTLITSAPFVLGHYGTNTNYYNKEAYESDVRIYATALSAEDIATLYHTPAQVDNLQNIHTFEFQEEGNKTAIYQNGVISITDEMHEANAELLNTVASGGYTPAKNTANSCINFGYANFDNYASLGQDLAVHIECDVEWTAFTADTGGTFKGVWFQGANYETTSSSFKWAGTNYICSALNSAFSLQTISTITTAGKHHYNITTTIPASWFATYSRSNLGWRCDYSDGTGHIDIKNLKITPLQYYNAKIGEDFISATQFIEK